MTQTTAAEKKPHEMMWSEFHNQRIGNPHFDQAYSGRDCGAYLRDTIATHKQHVMNAVVAGLPVATAILEDHFD